MACEGESLGRTAVVDEPRQIGHLIEHSVIPACPLLGKILSVYREAPERCDCRLPRSRTDKLDMFPSQFPILLHIFQAWS
jgi:hypothetical protein